MRPNKYDLTTASPVVGARPSFNPSAALGTPPPAAKPYVFPFQLTPGNDEDTVQLRSSSILSDYIGTLANITFTTEEDIAVASGDKIYLHGTVDSDGVVTSIEVAAFSSAQDPIVYDGGGVQTDFYLLLGFVAGLPADPMTALGMAIGNELWIYQVINTHLMMTAFCFNGTSIYYPVPGFGIPEY